MFVSNDSFVCEDGALNAHLFVIEACNAYSQNYEILVPIWPIKEEPYFGSEAPEFPVWELLEEASDSEEEISGAIS